MHACVQVDGRVGFHEYLGGQLGGLFTCVHERVGGRAGGRASACVRA